MPIFNVIDTGKVPIKLWALIGQIESEAIDQLVNVSNLPFIFKHISAMPDMHLGVGATVGSVIATKDCVIPAAVGVDIGCGMMAVKIDLPAEKVLAKLPELRHSIERAVPVGRNSNKEIADNIKEWFSEHFSKPDNDQTINFYINGKTSEKMMHQMGSLGGGNHFIEICLDRGNEVWVTLHSGSRNVGKTMADIFIDKAKDLCTKWHIPLPHPDLAYLPIETTEGQDYLKIVNFCQKFAFENREEMMRRIIRQISYVVNDKKEVETAWHINCHHNYIDLENHFGENVYVTRKGAIRMRTTDFGIIPGSMGSKSYIVKGKGNEESFCSASHGAGRKMSRTKAKELFTQQDLEEQTKGIECRKDKDVIDEIPGAYKDIDQVIENESDLVEVVSILKQVLCIKG